MLEPSCPPLAESFIAQCFAWEAVTAPFPFRVPFSVEANSLKAGAWTNSQSLPSFHGPRVLGSPRIGYQIRRVNYDTFHIKATIALRQYSLPWVSGPVML
jgi:hypothetical protein